MAINNNTMKYPFQMVSLPVNSSATGLRNALGKSKMLLIVAVPLLFVLGTVTANEVQGFSQYVRLNIDKGYYDMDGSGILVKNLDTGRSKIVSLTDSTRSTTQSIYVNGVIPASYGDRLQACVMEPSTKAMACDYQTAGYSSEYVDFYIDMSSAQRVPDSGGSGEYPDSGGSGEYPDSGGSGSYSDYSDRS
jgi:hypothetical protein